MQSEPRLGKGINDSRLDLFTVSSNTILVTTKSPFNYSDSSWFFEYGRLLLNVCLTLKD